MDPRKKISITTLSLIVILAAIGSTSLLYFFGPERRVVDETATTTKKSFAGIFPSAPVRTDKAGEARQIEGEPATESSPLGTSTPGRLGLEELLATSRLFKITESPIAGSALIKINGSTSPLYLDRATGHLYRVLEETRQVERLTNTTIPLTQETYWGNDGKNVRLVLRSLRETSIVNFSGSVRFSSTTDEFGNLLSGEIKGANWPEQIVSLAVSPAGNRVFTLRRQTTGVVGIISGWELKEKTTFFSSDNSEWLVAWPTENQILLNTKPSAELAGSIYLLNTKNKEFTELISGLPGLTGKLSPDGQKIILSETKNRSLLTKIYDLKTKKTTTLNFQTLAEKCVWSSKNTVIYCAVPTVIRSADYPDAWYRGEVSFSDALWRLNIETGETKMLINTAESNLSVGSIDIIELFLDKAEENIFFTNKTDGTFWLFELN